MKMKDIFYDWVLNLQDRITEKIHNIDPNFKLNEDNWTRKDFSGADGGGGRTRAFSNGAIFENAGVNVSKVYGKMDPEFSKQFSSGDDNFWACGISLIIHPINPKVPTVHANFRMIEKGDKLWFGGGADLTPFYPYPEDFKHFHQTWKSALVDYPGYYEKMKKVCDDYFVNYHRNNERRGIGGIFFDHYNENGIEKDFEMVKNLGDSFLSSYIPLVDQRKNELFDEQDKQFQLFRRGRYVEFNLLHDRGTTFGLKTKGRTKSILISLPGSCHFSYDYEPVKKEHIQLNEAFLDPIDWLN
jgi:coproporphyrinogen III oxidase